jgi:hypothetical protein
MPQLEQVVSQEEVVYRPKKRDSAGRDEQQARAMDLPPREGSRDVFPGSKERIALGGNKPMPPPISQVDEGYAETIAATHAEYPRVMYHKAFRRDRDAAGKIVAGGELTPLQKADEVNPGYPVPLSLAQRNNVKGILSGHGDSQAVQAQHLFRTCFVPLDWNPEHPTPIKLSECQKQETELAKAGWVRTPAELNLPKPRTLEEESDE